MDKLLPLVVGGSLGTVLRFLVSVWMLQWLGSDFPFGTLAVNILGCFMIGMLSGLPEGISTLSPRMRLFVVTGFIGGLTTFSSYQYESFTLTRSGDVLKAFVYWGGSLFVGLLSVLLGYLLMSSLLNIAKGG